MTIELSTFYLEAAHHPVRPGIPNRSAALSPLIGMILVERSPSFIASTRGRIFVPDVSDELVKRVTTIPNSQDIKRLVREQHLWRGGRRSVKHNDLARLVQGDEQALPVLSHTHELRLPALLDRAEIEDRRAVPARRSMR